MYYVGSCLCYDLVFGNFKYLSVKRIENQLVITGPVNEVLSAHDDVAIHSSVDVGLQRPSNVIRQRLTYSLNNRAGDTVDLAASDDLGVGEAKR